MKKVVHNLGILLSGLGFILVSSNVSFQEQRLTRKERLEIRRQENISNFERLDSLLESKRFFYILDEETYNRLLPWQKRKKPTLPYIMLIDSSNAILYLDSPYVINEGLIENWSLRKDTDKLCFYLQFKVIGPSNFWDLNFSLRIENDSYVYLHIFYLSGEENDFSYPIRGLIVEADTAIIRRLNYLNSLSR